MNHPLKTLNKLLSLCTLIMFTLVFVGVIFTSYIRNNVLNLIDGLINNGIAGFLSACLLVYIASDLPLKINKLIKAKGFNKKLWDSL
jgi:hypothetical protein